METVEQLIERLREVKRQHGNHAAGKEAVKVMNTNPSLFKELCDKMGMTNDDGVWIKL